jgi:hypothetical protein
MFHIQYYHHEKSRRTFRSAVEVVNFLLYEAYPDKPQTTNKNKSEEEYLVSWRCNYMLLIP